MDRDGLLRSLATRVRDERVLAAMAAVPRELFVRPQFAAAAYADAPLRIGHGQTISQPAVVARMAELLDLQPDGPRARRRDRLGLPRRGAVAPLRARLGHRARASSSRCAPRARCSSPGIENVTVLDRRRRRAACPSTRRTTRSTSRPRRAARSRPRSSSSSRSAGGSSPRSLDDDGRAPRARPPPRGRLRAPPARAGALRAAALTPVCRDFPDERASVRRAYAQWRI